MPTTGIEDQVISNINSLNHIMLPIDIQYKFLTLDELKGTPNHCGTHAIRSICNRKFGIVPNEKIIDDLVSHGLHGNGCTPFDIIYALHQLNIHSHLYMPNLEKCQKDAFICGLLSKLDKDTLQVYDSYLSKRIDYVKTHQLVTEKVFENNELVSFFQDTKKKVCLIVSVCGNSLMKSVSDQIKNVPKNNITKLGGEHFLLITHIDTTNNNLVHTSETPPFHQLDWSIFNLSRQYFNSSDDVIVVELD